MSSKQQVSSAQQPIKMLTTGDLRTFLGNVALAVAQGDMKVEEAVVAVKACEQINASLYSEIKSAAIQITLNKQAPEIGNLLIGKSA